MCCKDLPGSVRLFNIAQLALIKHLYSRNSFSRSRTENPSPKGRIKKTKRIANSPAQIVFIFDHKNGTKKRRPELPVRRYSKKASRNSQSSLTQKTILSRCFYCCSTASLCSLNRKTLFFVGEFLVCACYYFYFSIP